MSPVPVVLWSCDTCPALDKAHLMVCSLCTGLRPGAAMGSPQFHAWIWLPWNSPLFLSTRFAAGPASRPPA